MSGLQCPHCGGLVVLALESGGRGGRVAGSPSKRDLLSDALGLERAGREVTHYRRASGVGIVANAAVPDWSEVVFSEPARTPTREGDVTVPLLQAAVCGGVGLALAVVLAVSQRWAWWYPLVIGLLIFAAAWVVLLSDNRQLLRKVERYVSRDLDGDGFIGAPAQPDTVRLEVHTEGGGAHRLQFFDLPDGVNVGKVRTWARAVLGGRSLSESANIGSGGLFSRSEYGALLDALTAGGLVRWVNPEAKAQGRELTASGRAALRRWSDA